MEKPVGDLGASRFGQSGGGQELAGHHVRGADVLPSWAVTGADRGIGADDRSPETERGRVPPPAVFHGHVQTHHTQLGDQRHVVGDVGVVAITAKTAVGQRHCVRLDRRGQLRDG